MMDLPKWVTTLKIEKTEVRSRKILAIAASIVFSFLLTYLLSPYITLSSQPTNNFVFIFLISSFFLYHLLSKLYIKEKELIKSDELAFYIYLISDDIEKLLANHKEKIDIKNHLLKTEEIIDEELKTIRLRELTEGKKIISLKNLKKLLGKINTLRFNTKKYKKKMKNLPNNLFLIAEHLFREKEITSGMGVSLKAQVENLDKIRETELRENILIRFSNILKNLPSIVKLIVYSICAVLFILFVPTYLNIELTNEQKFISIVGFIGILFGNFLSKSKFGFSFPKTKKE